MGKSNKKNRKSTVGGNKVKGLPKEELMLLKAMIAVMTNSHEFLNRPIIEKKITNLCKKI